MSYSFGRINDLAFEINKNARDKGFYEDYEYVLNLVQDSERATNLVKNLWLGTRLMLIVSEMGEALEAVRDGNFSHEPKSGGFHEELADGAIRLFDLAESVPSSSNLEQTIINKMDYNSGRPKKHGRVAL